MTTNQILEEIEYGKDYMANKALKEEISECYDKDTAIFYASKRAKELSGRAVFTESEEARINKIISNLSALEERLEMNKPMSLGYKKLKSEAIAESCLGLQEEVTNPRKKSEDKIRATAKLVATAKYFINENVDDSCFFKESSNPLFNKVVKEDISNIEDIISKL